MNEINNGPEKKPEATKISITISPMVKGIAAIVIGAVLLLCSFKMILHILCFISGLFLVYYGLVILHIKYLTDYIDWAIEKIKSVLVRR